MKTVTLIWHTDNHQTKNSYRLVGVSSGVLKSKMFKMLIEDKDAICDVEDDEGLIVMESYTVGKINSNEEFFNTSSNFDREQIRELYAKYFV